MGLRLVLLAVAKDAGIEHLRVHDLRHGFASAAVTAGASLYLVGRVLGHTQSKTTERYAHLADDPIRAVADATARRIDAALKGNTTDNVAAIYQKQRGHLSSNSS